MCFYGKSGEPISIVTLGSYPDSLIIIYRDARIQTDPQIETSTRIGGKREINGNSINESAARHTSKRQRVNDKE